MLCCFSVASNLRHIQTQIARKREREHACVKRERHPLCHKHFVLVAKTISMREYYKTGMEFSWYQDTTTSIDKKRVMDESQAYFLINGFEIENISCFLDTCTHAYREGEWGRPSLAIIDALYIYILGISISVENESSIHGVHLASAIGNCACQQ